MFVANQNAHYLDRIFKNIYVILNVTNASTAAFFATLGKCRKMEEQDAASRKTATGHEGKGKGERDKVEETRKR